MQIKPGYVLTAVAGITVVPIVAEWFVRWAEQKGLYDNPENVVTDIIVFTSSPYWVLFAVGLLGATTYYWVDKLLGTRTAKHAEIQVATPQETEQNELVRIKNALIYLAFYTDTSIEIKTRNPAEEGVIIKRYIPLIGVSERIFEMAAQGHIDVYGREIIWTSKTTRHLTDCKIIPPNSCKYIGLRSDYPLVPEIFDDDDYWVEAEESDQSQFESPFDEKGVDRNTGFWTDIRIDMDEVKKLWKPPKDE